MLNLALVKDADDKLALACAAVAKVGEGATPEERLAVTGIIHAVTEASRMLMELAGLKPPCRDEPAAAETPR